MQKLELFKTIKMINLKFKTICVDFHAFLMNSLDHKRQSISKLNKKKIIKQIKKKKFSFLYLHCRINLQEQLAKH